MKQFFIRNLAASFLAGPWLLDGLLKRGAQACGRRERWLRPLVRRVLTAFPEPPPGHEMASLMVFLAADARLARALAVTRAHLLQLPHQLFWATPTMSPAPWQVPALPTPGALGEWLNLAPNELDWFADCHGREAKVPAGPLRHYTYRWLSKSTGKARLLEMPKQRLKAIQRRVLHEILDILPPHEAVHSYRPGRSVASYVAGHAGHALVMRLDLRDFFPSIPGSRVHALFRTLGYPHGVARLLTGLCTNVVPWDVWQSAPVAYRESRVPPNQQLFRRSHLPQGAPTSPSLANLCAHRLDCRLAALAKRLGACYTRYADDLAFSGDKDLERQARRLQVCVCRIALEEGFEVHTRKTRFMRQGVRQQLCGIVVNAHPNIQRDEFDRLKAVLHNCIRNGPTSQNHEGHPDFRSYLSGRIAYVSMLNEARGRRLRDSFEQIAWDQDNQSEVLLPESDQLH